MQKIISRKIAKANFNAVYNSPFKVINAINKASKKQSPGYVPEIAEAFKILGIEKLDLTFFDAHLFNYTQDKNGYIRYNVKSLLCKSSVYYQELDITIGVGVVDLIPNMWVNVVLNKANDVIKENNRLEKVEKENARNNERIEKRSNFEMPVYISEKTIKTVHLKSALWDVKLSLRAIQY